MNDDVINKEVSGKEEEVIPQNHEKGPGWFLKTSYVVILAFCVYYLFTFWSWKSDYELQQEQAKKEAIEILK